MARPSVKIAAAATGAAHLPLAGRRPRGLKYRGERIAGEPVNRRTFILIFAAGLLAGCGKRKKLPALPPGSGVLAFGDSVTWGTGAAPGEDWPSRLATATGWQIHNAGVPGDTAEAARSRLPALLAAQRPALVIIEIGGNDFLRRRPAQAVKEDVRHLVRAAAASGAQVVLVAVPELSLLGALTQRPSDATLYRELGDEEKVPVIASVFADTLANPEWRADQIHPNAEGYRHMAAGIESALRQSGLL
jgi:acyl-CoA hydrolase